MKSFYSLILSFLLIQTTILAQGPSSRAEAKIDLVQSQYGLAGEGVLAVVMDRGVDYRHPDFIDENGNTRIAYIYDLYDDSGANDADNPYGVGTIYDAGEINMSLQQGGQPLVNDIFGHGTATTGIFAGDGSAIGNDALYKGVATKATIISIIVTRDYVPPFGSNPGQQGQFNPNLLSVAFEFAEDKIAELGMPSVTLLNIGSIGDPTDGSVQMCDLIDGYVDAGHAFVCGVGDDGGQDNHAVEQLITGTTTTFQIQKGESGFLRFSAWYDEDARCQLMVERPDGSIEGPFDPPQNPSEAKDVFLNQMNIFHRGADVEFSGSSSNLRQLNIDMTGASGVYKVNLMTTGLGSDDVIHGMLNPSRYYNNNRFINFTAAGGNINSYSSCDLTISPGDYVANNTYKDINGITRMRVGEGDVGELWIGSSAGPTMDNRLGIDFVAPGELAVGAYSLDSYYGSFSFNVMENSAGHYGIQNAVSGAAPIVAGVIALMLELNPALTPEEIKVILQQTARQDNFTGSTPNAGWGHGKLDALEAINAVLETGTAEVSESHGLVVSPNPFGSELSIKMADAKSNFIDVSIYSLTGSQVYQSRILPDETVDLQGLHNGIYFLRAQTGSRIMSAKIVKR